MHLMPLRGGLDNLFRCVEVPDVVVVLEVKPDDGNGEQGYGASPVGAGKGNPAIKALQMVLSELKHQSWRQVRFLLSFSRKKREREAEI